MQRILVVEDDFDIRELLQNFLQEAGYEVAVANDGVEALSLFAGERYDLIVLDIMLPKIDGYGVCEVIRQKSNVPIIMLTALDGEESQIKGLDLQADDYITKPFSPKELVLRVNNIIKRAYRDDNNRISIDGYELDEEQRKIYADNVEIELTTKEFDLLMMFIKNKGIAFSRDKILENVWDENYFGSDRVVDDTLRRLRKKLPNLNIHTIYGYGYRLG